MKHIFTINFYLEACRIRVNKVEFLELIVANEVVIFEPTFPALSTRMNLGIQ